MLAPQGYKQVIDSRAYTNARAAVSRRVGMLRWALPMAVLSAALLCGGVLLLCDRAVRLSYVLTGAVLVMLATFLLLLWFKLLPDAVKRRSKRDYLSYDRLLNPVEVSFTADDMTLVSAVMTRTVAFAKTRVCIETPARFVVLTDEGYTVILEKACFADREATEAFLRDVFARRIVKETKG